MTRETRFALTATRVFLFLCFILAAAFPALAQVQLGTTKFGSFGGGPMDTINLGNLNVHFTFPVLHKPGRGLPFNFDLTYDTTFWAPTASGSNTTWCPYTGCPSSGSPVPTWGWSGSALNAGTIRSGATGYDSSGVWSCETVYTDGFGTTHSFPGPSIAKVPSSWGCAYYDGANDWPLIGSIAVDGSGYTFSQDVCYSAIFPSCLYYTDSNGKLVTLERLLSANGNHVYPFGTKPL